MGSLFGGGPKPAAVVPPAVSAVSSDVQPVVIKSRSAEAELRKRKAARALSILGGGDDLGGDGSDGGAGVAAGDAAAAAADGSSGVSA